MPDPMLPFGEYRPDVSDYEGIASQAITNVIPRGDGYGPFQDHLAFTKTLPAPCRGFFTARKSDGSVQTFAGTATDLYQLNNTNFTWTRVSSFSNVNASVSITAASPAVVTWTGSNFSAGQAVEFTAGTLPTGLSLNTVYYVVSPTTNTFEIAATPGGTPINTTGSNQSGITGAAQASYGSLSSAAQWTFAQFGNLVFATQANAVLQVFNLSSSTAFAAEQGSPPQAAYVVIVGQFVVLLGLQSLPFRMQWSGLGDPTNWTAGVNQSDFQDFTDGGITMGAAGGEYGVIFQASVIRQMTYAPGSSYIFQITRICEDQGLLAPYALIKAASNIIFLSGQGFQLLSPSSLPRPIGKERVDRSFLADWDASQPQLIVGANDPNATRVYFGYKSGAGAAGLMDVILAYDYVLDRWAPMHGLSLQYIATAAKPGVTLEGLDVAATQTIAITGAANNGSGKVRLTVATINLPPEPIPPRDGASVPSQLTTGMKVNIWNVGGTTEANGEVQTITVIDSTHIDLPNVTFVNAYTSGGVIAGSIDTMTVSLDSFGVAGNPALGGFNASGALGFFNGPNLEAKLESSEKGDAGTRLWVQGFRPVTDAAATVGSVSYRENLQASRQYSPEYPLTLDGFIPASFGNGEGGISTRYARGKIRIPYGSTWTYAMGIEPETVLDGTFGGFPAVLIDEAGPQLVPEGGMTPLTP